MKYDMIENPFKPGDKIQVSDNWVAFYREQIESSNMHHVINSVGTVTEVEDNSIYVIWDYGDEEWWSASQAKYYRSDRLDLL